MAENAPSHSPSPRSHPLPLDEVAQRLATAVERSPADETEVVWLETLSGRAAHPAAGDGESPAAPEGRRTVVQVRVRERGRVGFHRTGGPGGGSAVQRFGGLEATVRLALGQARLAPPGPPLPLPGPAGRRESPTIHDPAVAALTPRVAADLLAAGAGPGDHLLLEWHELRLAVANSRGLVRSEEATSLTLTVRQGEGSGAGWAAGSSRSLAELAAPEVVQRAARRAARGARHGGSLPEGGPVLLSAEAAARVVQCIADAALTSRAFLDRASWLAGRLDQPVFGRTITLVDDGTDPAGLPFPCDADGWPRRRVVLVEDGVLLSPAVDAELGRELDRTPTPHAVAFDESRAGNLFLQPGGASPEELRRAAEGGLCIADLAGLRCTDPTLGTFRAAARGVRRVEDGALGAALPDLAWHGDLGDLLAAPVAVGAEPRVLAAHGAWGGTSAPALVLPAAEGLAPAPESGSPASAGRRGGA